MICVDLIYVKGFLNVALFMGGFFYSIGFSTFIPPILRVGKCFFIDDFDSGIGLVGNSFFLFSHS